jgi:hypothetical protein
MDSEIRVIKTYYAVVRFTAQDVETLRRITTAWAEQQRLLPEPNSEEGVLVTKLRALTVPARCDSMDDD